jgi:hypothetical protein
LRAIDRAVRCPTIFELRRLNTVFQWETQVIAASKRPSRWDPTRLEPSAYFASRWLPANTPRSPMPAAPDLAILYAALLAPLVPVSARPHESLQDWISRAEIAQPKLQEIESMIERMQAKQARAKRPDRIAEFSGAVEKLKAELDLLTR